MRTSLTTEKYLVTIKSIQHCIASIFLFCTLTKWKHCYDYMEILSKNGSGKCCQLLQLYIKKTQALLNNFINLMNIFFSEMKIKWSLLVKNSEWCPKKQGRKMLHPIASYSIVDYGSFLTQTDCPFSKDLLHKAKIKFTFSLVDLSH